MMYVDIAIKCFRLQGGTYGCRAKKGCVFIIGVLVDFYAHCDSIPTQ